MRVLIAVHGHPRLSSGGGENAAYALHQGLKRLDGVTSCFLAAADDRWLAHRGDLGSLAPDEWLMRRSACGFFYPSAVRLDAAGDLAKAVCSYRPDVIHLHHFFHLGLDLIHALRRWCPQARIVFTLHEFLSFCAFNGQLRRRDGRLCAGPTAMDCQLCLPERTAADLLLRDQLVRSSLAQVDAFIAPSCYLIDRWQQWLSEQMLSLPRPYLIDNLLPAAVSSPVVRPRRRRGQADVFAYFGQVLPSKGLELLLDAWQRLIRSQPSAHLVIHGRLPQPDGELRAFAEHLQHRLAALGGSVTLAGAYAQEQLPDLMGSVDWVVMASLWPENSPVVIQEARACGRPLLVPAMGGMAEKVRDGWDGLHYAPHSSLNLSELMQRCCEEPALWERLRDRQAAPPDQEALLQAHVALYRGEEPLPVEAFPSASARLALAPLAWLGWSELASAASPSVHGASLLRLPGELWQVELKLPVPHDGVWELSLGWDGAFLEQRWLESSEGLLRWGWLCPDSHAHGSLHRLEWQLRSTDPVFEPIGGRLIWADPRFAPAAMTPQAWMDSLNQLGALAATCGDLPAVALEADLVVLECLGTIWPLLSSGPALDERAAWCARSTGVAWELQRTAD